MSFNICEVSDLRYRLGSQSGFEIIRLINNLFDRQSDVLKRYNTDSVHDKFHRILVLSGFFFLKIASTFLNSSFFPKPIKRRIAI